MSRVLTAALAALILAGPATAQDPPYVLMSAWKCDVFAMGDIAEMARDRMAPIAQELKDEGAIFDFAMLGHEWGDEWTVVMVTVGADMAALRDGVRALRERYAARHDDLDTFLESCPSHRDNVQQIAWFTDNDDDVGDGEPVGDAVVLSQWACPAEAVGEIAAMGREVMLPAAQASVDEGNGYFVGMSTHTMGDEWTVTNWRGAEDIPTLLTFVDDVNRRAGELAGDRPNPFQACTGHRDSIYRLMAVTD